MSTETIKLYSTGEWFPLGQEPEGKEGDYEIRKKDFCNTCNQNIMPHYSEPFASCDCYTQEWYI